jgi:hypothetical protein
MAMLTGIIDDSIVEYNISGEIDWYRRIDSSFHDHLPFVWNDYERAGYATSYQEDQPSIAIFNYMKNGFRYWPTCFYDRGFWLKYYEIRSGPGKCHYRTPTYLTWLDQIRLFVENFSYVKNVPYFSLNFLTEYTHNHLAIPSGLDLKLQELIQNFENNRFV